MMQSGKCPSKKKKKIAHATHTHTIQIDNRIFFVLIRYFLRTKHIVLIGILTSVQH